MVGTRSNGLGVVRSVRPTSIANVTLCTGAENFNRDTRVSNNRPFDVFPNDPIFTSYFVPPVIVPVPTRRRRYAHFELPPPTVV